MGCAASKLENEDTVRRCKDRRRLMKEAVYARHHLAAAHSDYCRSLRLTGTALSTFAAGEPLSVSDNTPAVFINHKTTTPTPTTATKTFHHPPKPQPPSPSPSSFHHRPPPQQPFQPSPSPTITSSKLPHILSSSTNEHHHPRRRKPPPPKLPHILSDSSPSSTPRSNFSNNFAPGFFPTAHSTYSSTPSQTSSVWNWENFYPPPPPPPGSDYFDREHEHDQEDSISQFSFKSRNSEIPYSRQQPQQQQQRQQPQQPQIQTYQPQQQQQQRYPNPTSHEVEGFDSERSEYDYFNRKLATVPKNPSHHHLDEQHTETEREEVECSEWGDHYSTTSSSEEEDEEDGEEDDDGIDGDVESRSEIGTRSNFGSSSAAAKGYGAAMGKSDDVASSSTGEGVMEMKMVVRHRDLKEIVDSIKENFDKAAVAGDQVSEMLEISKAQLDRSFRQLRKTVYHSNSLLSSLSSTWTSKPPLAVRYRLEPGSLNEPGGLKSLCSSLERLLAWEKKLYDEVKSREGVKIEHEKKLSVLQSQEYKGDDEAKIFKTKTSINKLQSLIVVTSQAVSTTSTAIVGLRDSDLVPQLVELCHGMMYMWRSMHQYHEVQSNIVQQVRGLVNRSGGGDSTSELHRQATRDLESAVSAWHSSFCRLIKFQRDFILSLHGWFKLSLMPVDNDNVNNRTEHSDADMFFDDWKLALDRVPDTVASFSVHNKRKRVVMLGVFSSSVVSPPDELVAAGSRTPSPKTTSAALLKRFSESNASTVSVEVGDQVRFAYTHQNESSLHPRMFGVKDEIFCMFEGALDNLGSLRQQYGLAKSANEVVLVIEAYKALRDRAPYPPNHVVGHLSGDFAFILFDKSTSTLFVASDQFGKVPLFWGITADGNVVFADDAELLKGACGKSLASFPQGCFYSTSVGGLMCYENPKNKITAVPAKEEEIWGATFKVEGATVVAARE